MKKRSFGRTGLHVSEIGFGSWAIGGDSYGQVRDEDSLEALEAAWSAGVNFYETADTYGEGHSETLLGRFLKGKAREQVIIATKAGWDFYPPAQKQGLFSEASSNLPKQLNHVGHKKNFDARYLRFACEQSLKRLDIEAVDVYQLHNPSLEMIQRGDVLGVLEGLKKQGKVRFIGISVHTEPEAMAVLEDSRVDSIQVIFNLLDQRMAAKVFAAAKEKGVGVIVREPLAHGLLTGKYPPSHEFPKNDHRRRWVREKRELDWGKIQKIRSVLEGASLSLAKAALEYTLAFEEVSIVIPGAKTREQVMMNVAASLKPELSEESMMRLKEIYAQEEIFKQGLNPR